MSMTTLKEIKEYLRLDGCDEYDSLLEEFRLIAEPAVLGLLDKTEINLIAEYGGIPVSVKYGCLKIIEELFYLPFGGIFTLPESMLIFINYYARDGIGERINGIFIQVNNKLKSIFQHDKRRKGQGS